MSETATVTIPSRESLLARVRKTTGSAAFKAAVAARKKQVAASAPRKLFMPEVGKEIFCRLVDFTPIQDPKTKDGRTLKGATKYDLWFAIHDPASKDHGRKFPIYYTIFPAGKNDKRDDSIDASRIRAICELVCVDEHGDSIPCEDESQWSDILIDIICNGLVFRGEVGAFTNKKGFTNYYFIPKEEVVPADDEIASGGVSEPLDPDALDDNGSAEDAVATEYVDEDADESEQEDPAPPARASTAAAVTAASSSSSRPASTRPRVVAVRRR